MDKELIERMKRNRIAFGLMTPEDRECLKKVGKENCRFYNGEWMNPGNVGCFTNSYVYAIKSGYQLKPEFINIEIELQPYGIGKYVYYSLVCLFPTTNAYIPIDCLSRLVGFQGFFAGAARLRVDEVSTHMEGKPYARFKTERQG